MLSPLNARSVEGEMTAAAVSEPAPVASVLHIENGKLDLAGCVFVDGYGHEVALTRAESSLLR